MGHFPRVASVVAGQFAHEAAIGAAAQQADERLDARIRFHRGGKTNIQRFRAHREKVQPGLLGGKPDADAGIGPTRMDRLRHRGVTIDLAAVEAVVS